jgi:hypothetical protein
VYYGLGDKNDQKTTSDQAGQEQKSRRQTRSSRQNTDEIILLKSVRLFGCGCAVLRGLIHGFRVK